MIKVVNKITHSITPDDIYIGRGSALGNPYTGSKKVESTKAEFQCESRDEAINKYSQWLDDKIKQKDSQVRKALNEIYLKAKRGDVNLVCYCSPQNCHGDIIKNKIEHVLRIKNKIIMAKAINLELYEGELNGVYQKLWVVTSENGNFFEIEPQNMVWKENVKGNNPFPDFNESKIRHIHNNKHLQITMEMIKKKEINLERGANLNKKSKSMGM